MRFLKGFCILLCLFGLPVFGQNLGHRMGGDVYGPENTLCCYEKALEHLVGKENFHYVELDVQETRDGKVVVFHDMKSIKRLVPRSVGNLKVLADVLKVKRFEEVTIADLSLKEVKGLVLKDDARIPELEEVFQCSIKHGLKKPILVEVKRIRTDGCREDLVKLLGKYRGVLAVDFLAFRKNFEMSFPDEVRWGNLMKSEGLRVFTSMRRKVAKHDLIGGVKRLNPLPRFHTAVEEQGFSVRDEASRVLDFPVKFPLLAGGMGILRVGVFHGDDDSGDKGVRVKLLDGEGNVIAGRLAKGKGWEWFEVPVAGRKDLVVRVEDKDTKFGRGEESYCWPGCGCSCEDG